MLKKKYTMQWCSAAGSVDDTIFLIMFLLMTAGIWNMVCIKGDKISEGVLIFIRTQRNDLGYVQFGALFYNSELKIRGPFTQFLS